ncbi:hypothetical protein CCMSSC00406_0003022 [Pleurotus cornucopiae]|nr:hypothetical protein CCMSSC00406_0003022 [Pleurotus cornucopiae]
MEEDIPDIPTKSTHPTRKAAGHGGKVAQAMNTAQLCMAASSKLTGSSEAAGFGQIALTSPLPPVVSPADASPNCCYGLAALPALVASSTLKIDL